MLARLWLILVAWGLVFGPALPPPTAIAPVPRGAGALSGTESRTGARSFPGHARQVEALVRAVLRLPHPSGDDPSLSSGPGAYCWLPTWSIHTAAPVAFSSARRYACTPASPRAPPFRSSLHRSA